MKKGGEKVYFSFFFKKKRPSQRYGTKRIRGREERKGYQKKRRKGSLIQ